LRNRIGLESDWSDLQLCANVALRSYNDFMTRGWESKSVEQQQEEASSAKTLSVPLTPEQATREKRRQGLLLSRQRVLQQLEAASNPRHRQMLEAALADLDARLKDQGA